MLSVACGFLQTINTAPQAAPGSYIIWHLDTCPDRKNWLFWKKISADLPIITASGISREVSYPFWRHDSFGDFSGG